MPLHGTYEPSTDDFSREQVELIERTNGAEGTTMRGMPVIVLVSRGAKSGKIRKIPLMRVEHDGQYAVVASLGGAPKHPTWYYNLVAHPHVELRDGAVVRDYLARELEGAERETWWARSVEAYPDYADYAIKTSRLIPVFVLEPVDPEVAEQHDSAAAAGAGTHAETAAAAGSDAGVVAGAADAGLPYEETEQELERIEKATELDDEIAEFWENARVQAGLGRIAVVGGLTVAENVAPVAWSFGDNPEQADRLLGLVLDGTKTATSSALSEYDGDDAPLPREGDLSIVVDGAGHPKALIRTTDVAVVPFGEVSDDFAAAEGEGDRSLEAWRTDHTEFFTRVLGLVTVPEDFMVVTERFELLYPR
jgi:deazaflavin-dependent oxidoreductase (nitroreductase family)